MKVPFLFQCLVTVFLSTPITICFAQQKKIEYNTPNIILIMADDLGFGDVGFNGNKRIKTPYLDKMSEDGVKFTNFYAAAPLCSPTRASVLTGRSPFRQGVFAAHTSGMRAAEVTIAEILKKEGYKTGFFGKWHLGWVEPDTVETRGIYSPPWHHGYDKTFATKSAVPTWNPTKTPKGWKGFGSKDDGSWGGSVYIEDGQRVTENLDGDDSRIIMDRAIPFIEETMEKEEPFFATIWFHTPHDPVFAGPEYVAKYPKLPNRQKHLYGAITAMDEQIGRLLKFLEDKHIEDNTIIFFCSDNGPSGGATRKKIASAGPFRGYKHQMWEGGLRVPSLIVWRNHIKAGQVSDYQSSTVDYLPTILDFINIPINKKIPLDGVSLKSVVLNNHNELRTIPIASGYQRLYKKTELYAYIKGNYKICIPEVGKKMMLFDLATDPSESHDLASEKPDLLKQMIAGLEQVKESWRLSREGKDYEW